MLQKLRILSVSSTKLWTQDTHLPNIYCLDVYDMLPCWVMHYAFVPSSSRRQLFFMPRQSSFLRSCCKSVFHNIIRSRHNACRRRYAEQHTASLNSCRRGTRLGRHIESVLCMWDEEAWLAAQQAARPLQGRQAWYIAGQALPGPIIGRSTARRPRQAGQAAVINRRRLPTSLRLYCWAALISKPVCPDRYECQVLGIYITLKPRHNDRQKTTSTVRPNRFKVSGYSAPRAECNSAAPKSLETPDAGPLKPHFWCPQPALRWQSSVLWSVYK